MRETIAAVVFLLASGPVVGAQTPPTKAEIEQWQKNPATKSIEATPCKEISWLLENEAKLRMADDQRIRDALGWWGRGFVQGATYMIDVGIAKGKGNEAMKKADAFGLSAEVVGAHIATYCHGHEAETPGDAIQDLLAKVLK
jgi:hypothetical protein